MEQIRLNNPETLPMNGQNILLFLHDGHEDFKAYNIVRVSNLGRKVVYQQTGGKLK